jgi:alpha-glucoside transport system ATP-binding protein
MNFIPVEIAGVNSASAKVSLPGGRSAAVRLINGDGASGAAELGVRPEHFLVVPVDDASASFPGKVAIVEHLGNATILYVDTPAGQLIVEGRGELVARSGDTLGLKIEEPHAHLFGASGSAL